MSETSKVAAKAASKAAAKTASNASAEKVAEQAVLLYPEAAASTAAQSLKAFRPSVPFLLGAAVTGVVLVGYKQAQVILERRKLQKEIDAATSTEVQS